MRRWVAWVACGYMGVASAAPYDLVHSGRLTNAAGTPISGHHDVDVAVWAVGGASALQSWSFAGQELEGGYYSVTLTGFDIAWLSQDLELAVTLDGTALSPRQPLGSAPRALQAASVPVVASSGSSCATKGLVVYDDAAGALKVCNGTAWIGTGGTIQIVPGTSGRTWADGALATSCETYRRPPTGRAYAGETGDGQYRIDPDGSGTIAPLTVWCDMTTDNGGWTLLATLRTTNTTGTAMWPSWTGSWFTVPHGTVTTAASTFTNHDFRSFRPLVTSTTVLKASLPTGGTSRYMFGMTATDWDDWNSERVDGLGVSLVGPFNRANVRVSTSASLTPHVMATSNGHWSSGFFYLGTGSGQGDGDTEGLGARYHVASNAGPSYGFASGSRQNTAWFLWLK